MDLISRIRQIFFRKERELSNFVVILMDRVKIFDQLNRNIPLKIVVILMDRVKIFDQINRNIPLKIVLMTPNN
jgi:hypothetical protein